MLKKVNSDILASSLFHKNFALESYLLLKQKKNVKKNIQSRLLFNINETDKYF